MQLNAKLIALLPLMGYALADKAPKIKRNPKHVVAIADLPFGGDKKIMGNVVFTAKKGKVVNVHVDVTGLPKEGGPFQYHIHEDSVPEDGDCEKVGDHFNPYDAPEECDEQKDDSYCEVGDLSGKHGWINATCFETKYNDPYLSLNKKSKSYIVGKSIVFHYANLTKFACADIELASHLRLQSLQEEYNSNENTDLSELDVEQSNIDVDSNISYQSNDKETDSSAYESKDDEGLQTKDYEELETKEDVDSKSATESQLENVESAEDLSEIVHKKLADRVVSSKSNDSSTNSTYNGYDWDHKNKTNASSNDYDHTETENGSPGLVHNVGATAAFGILVGLLL